MLVSALPCWELATGNAGVLRELRRVRVGQGATCQQHHGVEVQAVARGAGARVVQPVRPHALDLQPALWQPEARPRPCDTSLFQKVLQPPSWYAHMPYISASAMAALHRACVGGGSSS